MAINIGTKVKIINGKSGKISKISQGAITVDLGNNEFQVVDPADLEYMNESKKTEKKNNLNEDDRGIKVLIKYKTDLGKEGERTYTFITNNESDAANKAYNAFNKWAKDNKINIINKMANIQESNKSLKTKVKKRLKSIGINERLLNEGTMAHGIFNNDPKKAANAIIAFKNILKKPILAKNYEKEIYIYVFDDNLFDNIDNILKKTASGKYDTTDITKNELIMKNIYDLIKAAEKNVVKKLGSDALIKSKLNEEAVFNMTRYKEYMNIQPVQLHKTLENMKKRVDDFINFANRFDWTKITMTQKKQLKLRLEDTESQGHLFLERVEKMLDALNEETY